MSSTDRVGNSSSRIFFVVMVAGALVFGLALGFKLGSESPDRVAVVPSRPPTASVAPTPTAEPTSTPQPTTDSEPSPEPTFPPPPIRPASVDEALLQAYYAAGAGISVCVVYDQPTCVRRDTSIKVSPVYPPPQLPQNDFESLFGAGPVEHPGVGSIIIVEDLGAAQVAAVVFSEESLPFGLNVTSVDPGNQGIHFIDLGGLSPGRSVVVVQSLPLDPPPTDQPIMWRANVIAFDVTPPNR